MKAKHFVYAAICLIVVGFGLIHFDKQDQSSVKTHKTDNTSITVINVNEAETSIPWKIYLGFGCIALGLMVGAKNLKLRTKEEQSEVSFTKKEIEIIEAIKKGKTNKEIAQEQYLSLNTIKTHTSNIYNKAGVNSRSQLIEKLNK